MGVLARFFGGISITGYIYTFLVTVLLGLAVSVWFLNRANDKLEQEIAVSEHAIMTLVDVNQQNRKSISELEQLATECADKRSAAEKAAREAKLELSLRTLESNQRKEDVVREISKVVDECNCVVPPRTVRLLLDATCSANRSTDCP